MRAAFLYDRPEDFDMIDRLVEVAGKPGGRPARVALAWPCHEPGVRPFS
jgi:aryl-alcohol dehydrogenase-like predicted oxidoreductase